MKNYSVIDKRLGNVLIEFNQLTLLCYLKIDVDCIIWDNRKHEEIGYINYKNDKSNVVLYE